MPAYAVLTTVANQPGALFGLTKVLTERTANITYVDIIHHPDRDAEIYLEFSVDATVEPIVEELRRVHGVSRVEMTPSFSKIYGKRIIIMGGDIARAVEEVRKKGLLVISLNQAGSVPDVADLVVSDPVQAGVMAVMAIADTATFDIVRQQKRRY